MRRRESTRRVNQVRLLSAAASVVLGASHAGAGIDQWRGPSGGAWRTPSNWSNGLPTATSDAVDNHTGGQIKFDTTATVNSFLSAESLVLLGGELSGAQTNAGSVISIGDTLRWSGGWLNNLTLQAGTAGSAVVFSNANNWASDVVVNADLTFSGPGAYLNLSGNTVFNGKLSLPDAADSLQLFSPGTMTVGVTGSVIGGGTINEWASPVAVVNNGTITANISGKSLRLTPRSLSGSGTFEARNGGTLLINGVITGGTSEATAPTFFVDTNPMSTILLDSRAGLTGFIGTSSGAISFNASGGNSIDSACIMANLSFVGNAHAILFGTNVLGGTVRLASKDIANLEFDLRSSGLLLPGASIRGYGAVGGQSSSRNVFTNSGVISADIPGQSLYLGMNIIGSGRWEARNGGTLVIGNGVTGLDAALSVESGSQIILSGGEIRGTFATTSGQLTIERGAIVQTTFGADLYFPSGASLMVTDSTLSGELRLAASAYSSGGYATITPSNAVLKGSISGHGAIGTPYSYTSLENEGRLSADDPVEELNVGVSLTGSGLLEARNGATLRLGGSIRGPQDPRFSTDGNPSSRILFDNLLMTGFRYTYAGSNASFIGAAGQNQIRQMALDGNFNVTGDAVLLISNTNTLAGVIRLSGTDKDPGKPYASPPGLMFNNGASITITSGGQLRGFGKTYDFPGLPPSQLVNQGLIDADVSGQRLQLLNGYTVCSGTIRAENGGMVVLGGALEGAGTGADIDAAGGTVLVDGGKITGWLRSSTGSGLTFSGSTNNLVTNLQTRADLTFPDGSRAQFGGTSAANSTIHLASNDSPIRFASAGASLTIGPTGRLHGFGGLVDETGTASFVNQGQVDADVPGKTLSIGVAWTTSGTVNVATGAVLASLAPFSQTGSSSHMTVDGTLLVPGGGVSLTGGTLAGDGTIGGGPVDNVGGIVRPGHFRRLLTLTGAGANYSQESAGTFLAELDGYVAGTSYDQLAVSGAAHLAGTLDVALASGFVPQVGDTFDLILYGSIDGNFENLISDAPGLTYSEQALSDRVRITITSVPEPASLLLLTGSIATAMLVRRRRRNCRAKAFATPPTGRGQKL